MKILYRYFVLPALPISIFFVCSTYLQTKKTPWVDECYTYYGITHEKWNGFFESICSGVNFSPPLYFFINWIIQLFLNISIDSLRIESAIFISLGTFLVFIKCAKSFSTTSAFLGCTLVLLQSDLLLEQAMEARHYGMFFACSTWVLLLFPINQRFNSTRHKTLYFIAHLSLCCTHYLGIIFSTLTGISRFFHQRKKRFPGNLPIVEICACAVALPIYFFLLSNQSAHLGNWPKPNTLSALLSIYCDSLILIVIIIPVFLALILSKTKLKRVTTKSFPLLTVAITWFLIPVICWIISHTSNLNLLKDRYFIPKEAAVMVLSSFFLQRFIPKVNKFDSSLIRKTLPLGTTFLLCIMLLMLSSKRMLFGFNPSIDYHSKLLIGKSLLESSRKKLYVGDHLFFPNYYNSDSQSGNQLIISKKELRLVYERFNSMIETKVANEISYPFIAILSKDDNSLFDKFPSNLYGRQQLKVHPDSLIVAHEIQSSKEIP